MIIITDDSSSEMGILVDHWLADLKASGFDEDALRKVSSILGQWAATGWQYCQEDGHGETFQHFIDWARQRGMVLEWLEEKNPNAN